jgi:NifU-like protein
LITELSIATRGHQLPGDPDALTTLFVGLSAEQALEVTHREIAIRLGGLPESKMYCSVLLHEALRAAVADAGLRSSLNEPHRRPCVTCRCFTVAEDLIRRAVRVNGLTSLEQVACYTRAGSGCGLCAEGIASILSALQCEAEPSHGPSSTVCCLPAATTTAHDNP